VSDNNPHAQTSLTLTVNGVRRTLAVEPWATFYAGNSNWQVRRQCGACTIFVDGKSLNSCPDPRSPRQAAARV